MQIARALAQAASRWQAPLIAAALLLCYWAPWLPAGTRTAWLAAAAWGALHGLHDLEHSSKIVTVAVTVLAVFGAACRLMMDSAGRLRIPLRQVGLFATCAPPCVLMPAPGAALYLIMLAMIVGITWIGSDLSRSLDKAGQVLWKRLLRESFPILAALCFLTMSWQYNAQWLTRGLLIAAGVSLVGRAALPFQKSAAVL